MAPTLYTIGHSNHGIAAFVELLRVGGVRRVADVRSIPYSRRLPQFRREALEAALAGAGVDYVWLGDELGGRPRDPALAPGGHPDYARMRAAPGFGPALDRLVETARGQPTAIMCAERDPLDCHRFHLLAEPLLSRGAEIVHLLADGARETQAEATARLAAREPQGSLFD